MVCKILNATGRTAKPPASLLKSWLNIYLLTYGFAQYLVQFLRNQSLHNDCPSIFCHSLCYKPHPTEVGKLLFFLNLVKTSSWKRKDIALSTDRIPGKSNILISVWPPRKQKLGAHLAASSAGCCGKEVRVFSGSFSERGWKRGMQQEGWPQVLPLGLNGMLEGASVVVRDVTELLQGHTVQEMLRS